MNVVAARSTLALVCMLTAILSRSDVVCVLAGAVASVGSTALGSGTNLAFVSRQAQGIASGVGILAGVGFAMFHAQFMRVYAHPLLFLSGFLAVWGTTTILRLRGLEREVPLG